MAAAKDNRIRVVRLLPELDYGGAESRVALQAEWIDRERFDFRVCTLHKPGAAAERIRNAGISVDVLGCAPSIRYPRTTWRLYRYLRRTRPHVLHASIGEANYHGALAGWLARVPRRIVEEVGLAEAHPLTLRMLRFAYRRAHTVIGVSQTVCDHVQKLLRLDPTRIRCIYNPVPPAFLEPIDKVPRGNGAPYRLLCVGRLVEEKNHAFLIRLQARFREMGLRTHLRIVGDGPLRPALEAEIARHRLGDEVELMGYRSDVPALLAQADLFLFPSTREGQPNAILEATACNVPVLASNIPSIVELAVPTAPLSEEAWAESVRKLLQEEQATPTTNGHVRFFETYLDELCELYFGKPQKVS